MRVDPAVKDKADWHLQKALQDASGDETVRALVTLDVPPPVRSDFRGVSTVAERLARRREAVGNRQQALAESWHRVIAALTELGLEAFDNGGNGPVVVVQGQARQIRDSLSLQGIRRVELDRTFQFTRECLATAN